MFACEQEGLGMRLDEAKNKKLCQYVCMYACVQCSHQDLITKGHILV